MVTPGYKKQWIQKVKAVFEVTGGDGVWVFTAIGGKNLTSFSFENPGVAQRRPTFPPHIEMPIFLEGIHPCF